MSDKHTSAKIYVIIVTWNGMKWLEKCLDALRQSSVPVETVVIDNGSTDGTQAFIKEQFPEVQLLEMEKNLGFGQANNEGMRVALKAGADYVYLLNQDAYVYPDMFEKLLAVAGQEEQTGRFGVYSPLHINGNIHRMDSQFKYYLKDVATNMVEDYALAEPRRFYEVACVPAAGWLIPRSTLEKVGGFDPIFFHYGEDHQYAQRVGYHGMSFCLVPSAKMIHDREDFGNAKMANHLKYFRTLKTEMFLNINLRPGRIAYLFTKASIGAGALTIKSLCKGRFKDAWDYQRAIFMNIAHIPQYARNRKRNKQPGPNWL